MAAMLADTAKRAGLAITLNPDIKLGGLKWPANAEGKRIRQKSGPRLNKTEQAFEDHLKVTLPDHRLLSQAISFRLGNGTNFRPDCITVSLNGEWTAWEVKGFARTAAIVRLKVAASLYPFIAFRLVTKQKAGGWAIERVLP